MSSSNRPWHPDVFEAALAVRQGQLALPVGAQAFVRAARPDTEIKHGVERAIGLLQVGGNDSFRQLVGRGAAEGACGGRENEAARGEWLGQAVPKRVKKTSINYCGLGLRLPTRQ